MNDENKKIDDQNLDDQEPQNLNNQNDDGDDKWTDDEEFNLEEYKKLKELEKNRKIELERKNGKLSEVEKKLAEYEKKEAELQEKEKLKKGKYEEVLAEKEKTIAELEADANAWREYKANKEKEVKENLANIKQELGEDIIKENEFFLTDLAEEKQLAFLQKIKEAKNPADFTNKTNWNDKKPDWMNSNYEKGKAKWSSTDMINWMFKDVFWQK